jgi:hypothetical protein
VGDCESWNVSILHFQNTRTPQLELLEMSVYNRQIETPPEWHDFSLFIFLRILRAAIFYAWYLNPCSNKVGHGEACPQHTVISMVRFSSDDMNC